MTGRDLLDAVLELSEADLDKQVELYLYNKPGSKAPWDVSVRVIDGVPVSDNSWTITDADDKPKLTYLQ